MKTNVSYKPIWLLSHTHQRTRAHAQLDMVQALLACSALLGFYFVSLLSHFSPAEIYCRCLTCSLCTFLLSSVSRYKCAHTHTHRLELCLTHSLDFGGVQPFDFVGSQPENVFPDGFLAEAMFEEPPASSLHLPAVQLRLVFFFPLQVSDLQIQSGFPLVSPLGPADQIPYTSVSLSGSAVSPSVNVS